MPVIAPQARDDAASDWTPLCMDADEFAAWVAMRDRSTASKDRAAIPCTDCLLSFAAEMRAAGTCNGVPHGVEEDEDMDLSKIPVQATPTRRRAVEVTAPPCASCAHEPICSLRAAFEGLVEIETSAPQLPDGLNLSLVATVTCAHFLWDKSKPAPVRGQASARKPMTPEHRANIRAGQERARAAREAVTS